MRPSVDGIDLELAGVVADDHEVFEAELVDGVDDADRGAFVGAEEASHVRVGGEHAERDVGRLLVLAGAVVGADDLDVGIHLSHPVEEAIAAVDAGAAGRVVHDDADLAGTTDGLGHLVGGERRSGDVVGRGGGDGDVTVDAGVEGDDGDAVGLELLERGQRGLAVERREADRVRVLAGTRPRACPPGCWTSDSVGGPSKLTVMFSSAALSSAPGATACQNWCWKPFETMGT